MLQSCLGLILLFGDIIIRLRLNHFQTILGKGRDCLFDFKEDLFDLLPMFIGSGSFHQLVRLLGYVQVCKFGTGGTQGPD